MDFPTNLRYTKDHEWIRLEEDGSTATIGITDFAQGELGDIVFVDIEPVDSEIAQDEIFGTVEAVKTVSDLYMPVSGKIVALNDTLNDHPERINESPYDEGWMVKIEVQNAGDLDALLSADEYQEMVGA